MTIHQCQFFLALLVILLEAAASYRNFQIPSTKTLRVVSARSLLHLPALVTPSKAEKIVAGSLKTPLPENDFSTVFDEMQTKDIIFSDEEEGLIGGEKRHQISEVKKEQTFLSFWGWRLAMLALTACWGANFPVIKYAMEALGTDGSSSADGSLYVAARFVISAALLMPFAIPGLVRDMSWRGIWAGTEVGLWIAFGYAAQALSLQLGTSADKAAFICCLQAVYVTLYKALVSKNDDGSANTVANRTWLALVMAVSGVGFLELGPALLQSGTAMSSISFGVGDLVALGQPVCFGMSYVVLERVMNKYPKNGFEISALQCLVVGIAATTAACAQAGVLSPFELPWGHLFPGAPEGAHLIGGQTVPPSWAVAASVAYTGAVGTALSIFAQSIVFTKLPAIEASVFLTTEPLWAAALAAILISEPFGTVEVIGGSLVLLACATNEGLLEKFFTKREETD